MADKSDGRIHTVSGFFNFFIFWGEGMKDQNLFIYRGGQVFFQCRCMKKVHF